jgi:hypothetical protein
MSLTISPLTVGGRTLADGVTTNGSPIVTSATGAFTSADVGRVISGVGIPTGSFIFSLNSATSVNISQNATATGSSISITIGAAAVLPAGTAGSITIITSAGGALQGAGGAIALSVVGAVGALTWELVAGRLPAGLTFTSDGHIAGIAQQRGAASVLVRVTDSTPQIPQFDDVWLTVLVV